MARGKSGKYSDNLKAIEAGTVAANAHPLIGRLADFVLARDGIAADLDRETWLYAECSPVTLNFARARTDMIVHVWPNIRRRASAEEWAYVFARMRLHIALNHIDPERQTREWHFACWFRAEELMSFAGVGQRPAEFPRLPSSLPRGDEKTLAGFLETNEPPPDLLALTLGRTGHVFWGFSETFTLPDDVRLRHMEGLANGIRAAASQAVNVAGGVVDALGRTVTINSTAQRARKWVISEFPLLAALASSFTLIEDADLCQVMDIQLAAISDETQEIFFNPNVQLSDDEARFVMVHEFLHVGLRHGMRRQGRDRWYWNVACDYVINDWLIEMRVGIPPAHQGYLHDQELRGLSAEEVYDRIVSDLRWMRKLKKARTLNGRNVDILDGKHGPSWWRGGGIDLDAFYRRSISEGLDLHVAGRGYLPAGLIEEVRSLMQPPIPWDVELAHWLDRYFPPLEPKRTYARASRRQSSSPDIPRPGRVAYDERMANRVFGAIVDSSGSMSRADLGKAVGAIASYAMSRDVGFVRFIQCDAAAHDSGYVEPETLLDRVQIKGRGGTVLMPAVRLLESAKDFPDDGPILIITDGQCDRLTISNPHAFLVAPPGRLPFRARGPVFGFS